MNDQMHYAPIIVSSTFPSGRERKFLVSLIATQRRGAALTERQAGWLSAIVRRFQDSTMRDDVIE